MRVLPKAVGLLLVLALAATAQAFTYRIQQYTELDGIPGSAVLGLDQDERGSLWVATRTGIARYDGTTWDLHGVDRGLPVASHTDVKVDHRGGIWAMATNTPVRVSRLLHGIWTTLPQPRGVGWGLDTIAMALGQDAEGEVTVAVLAMAGHINVWSGGHWQAVTLPEADVVAHDLVWQGSTLYLATSRGLYRVPDIAAAAPPEPVTGPPATAIYGVLPDPEPGSLTLVGRGWIGRLTPAGFAETARLPGLLLMAPEEGVAVGRDTQGGVYVGDRFTVFYHHPLLGLEELGRANGLVANGLTDVLVDRGGQVWLASMRGLNKLANRRFRNLNGSDGLLDDEVSAVLVRRDGTVVLGHVGGLTVMGAPIERIPLARSQYPWGRVIDIEESPDGGLVVAMDKRGLARIDPSGQVRWTGSDDDLPGAVYAVTYDEAGDLWVGASTGLYRQTARGFARVPLVEAGPEASVRRLRWGDDGSLLVASGRRGAFRLHEGRVERWYGDESSGRNSAYSVFDRGSRRYWIGTAGGLCRLVDGRIEPTTSPDPVIDHAVFAITRDARGRIWFGTDVGVYVLEDGDLRHFGVPDGLVGSETNRDALTVDHDGRVWIGTDRGVSVFDDRLVRIPRSPLPLWIDTVEINGIGCSMELPLELSAGTHELVLHFRSPGFADENRLRFQTFLAGYDTDWSTPDLMPSRSVRYTNLPAGRYRFEVRARDIEGRTSAAVVSPDIVVNPPIHQRPWFLALTALAALALVWLVFSLVQGRRYARRLTADVKKRTAELQAESGRLAAVLESISDGVIAVDAAGKVSLGNFAAAEILGRDHESLPGTPLETLLPGMGEAVCTALSADAGAAGELGPHFEFLAGGRGGAKIGLDCAVAPLSTGIEAGLVIAFRDVTERRRAEMERIRVQKLESLGVLAGGIAHDFNNLLTVTLGSTSLLESGCRPDQQPLIDQIREATRRAQGLTSQLLTFARGGAPQKQLSDLGPLLRDAANLALAGTNVSLELDLPDDLPHAEVDPGQLGQVISNLLINARQAMPRGGRVRLSANDAGQGRVEIRIRDEGCGIAADELDRIFEPYYTTKDNGTGLGLAISHSVVARHDGTMSVTSTPGVGTEFTIRLPASGQRLQPSSPPTPRPFRGGGRVLVLDDEPFVRGLLEQMLSRLGYETETVADGADAVAVYAAALDSGRPFATVIMDLTIPGGMGGKEAMERLLELDPHVRAIVSSGYSQDPVMADPRGYGFVATLGKPFDSKALALVLQKVLG